MGVDLALEDLVFQVFFLFFIFYLFFHEGDDVFRHLIDAAADQPQFILPFNGGFPGEIPLGYGSDFFQDFLHRAVDDPV